VNSRLTLNLGVRWEYNGAMKDKYGNLTQSWVSRIAAVPLPPTGPTTSGPGVSQWVVPSNFLDFYAAPPDGVLINEHKSALRKDAPLSNFGPRLGFAYQANSKLVVRGGVGLFYDRVGANTIIFAVEQGNPYAATIDFNSFNNLSLQSPFPATPVLGSFSSRFANFSSTCLANQTLPGCTSNLNVPFLAEVIHTPLIRQYNLGVQYQFAKDWVLEAGFVGSSSINLLSQYHNNNTARLASATNPINGVTANTTLNTLYRVPYLGYQAVGVRGTSFDNFGNYNSLQLTVRKRFSNGFAFQGAYTYSKNMAVQVFNQANGNNAGDLSQQYGPATFSRPQRFVVNYSYELPFGKHTGWLDRVASGWTVSGVTVIQGGTPITLSDQRAGTLFGTQGNSGAGYGRPQIAPGVTYADLATPGSVKDRLGGNSGGPGWFNKAALIAPPAMSPTGTVYYSTTSATGQAQCAAANPGTTCGTLFGNSGPGIIQGPGQLNFDMSLTKNTKIIEGHTLQFRAEFFNAFNHAQFTNPNFGQGGVYAVPNFAAGNFGQITSTSVNPRIIQLALKYIF